MFSGLKTAGCLFITMVWTLSFEFLKGLRSGLTRPFGEDLLRISWKYKFGLVNAPKVEKTTNLDAGNQPLPPGMKPQVN